jgi:hypothetical protein
MLSSAAARAPSGLSHAIPLGDVPSLVHIDGLFSLFAEMWATIYRANYIGGRNSYCTEDDFLLLPLT